MRRPATRRTLVTLRVLQAGCGFLAVASLIAVSQTPTQIAVHDGAATVASAHPAVPTQWRNAAGPLAVPTIGVVPPGSEDWFDPSAEPTFRAAEPVRTAAPVPSRASTTERGTNEAVPTTAASPTSATTSTADAGPLPAGEAPPRSEGAQTDAAPTPTPTTSPATTIPPATSPATTTPATTAPATTTPATTAPQTTAPETATPASTAPESPPPETPTPGSVSPSTTPPPTSETPTPPPVPTNARGNVVLALGQELTVFDGTGAAVFAIAVDAVDTEIACTVAETAPAVEGYVIALHVRVTTGPDLSSLGDDPAIGTSDFLALAADDVTLTGAAGPAAGSCPSDAGSLPMGPLTPNHQLAGTVVLAVGTATGTVVFAPDFMTVGAEWAYALP